MERGVQESGMIMKIPIPMKFGSPHDEFAEMPLVRIRYYYEYLIIREFKHALKDGKDTMCYLYPTEFEFNTRVEFNTPIHKIGEIDRIPSERIPYIKTKSGV